MKATPFINLKFRIYNGATPMVVAVGTPEEVAAQGKGYTAKVLINV